jgi:glyoxylase-like metal-dependent hydrolase (beta-lactamase superfamily II)
VRWQLEGEGEMTGKMTTAAIGDTRQLAPDLWVIDTIYQGEPGIIASYLLAGADGLALVDVGSGASLGALLANIAATGHDPRDITSILLTHVHLDHAGATGALLRFAPNAHVYVHSIGAPHLINPEKLVASATRIYGDQMEVLWGEIAPVPASRLTAIDDGAELRAGGRMMRALYTPGHAIHHVAFHDAERAALFTGDAAGVRLEGSSYVRPPTPPPDLNLEDWSTSIARMRAVKPSALYLPHFGEVTGDLDTHFDALQAGLYAWGDLMRKGIRAGESDTDLARDLAKAHDPEALRSVTGLSEAERAHELRRYELATNYLMSAQGYVRYYRKVRPDLLDG